MKDAVPATNWKRQASQVDVNGVVDLMQEFGLTLPKALEVSDHLPIWAEFSIYEGGQTGRMAAPNSAGIR